MLLVPMTVVPVMLRVAVRCVTTMPLQNRRHEMLMGMNSERCSKSSRGMRGTREGRGKRPIALNHARISFILVAVVGKRNMMGVSRRQWRTIQPGLETTCATRQTSVGSLKVER